MKQTRAFTMAEILLSLTIIGVVAAITLPSLTGNINERTWNTQRKALYARMSQAISLMPALNGYGTLTEDASGSITEDTATETFLTAGLAKVLKINNICNNNHFGDCGIIEKYIDMNGSANSIPKTLHSLNDWFRSAAWNGRFSVLNTNAAAFETQNGESIVAFYNRACKAEYISQATKDTNGDITGFPEATMCLNFIYDLNGIKGPNTVGKDIGFITVFNSTDSVVVAPIPSSKSNAAGPSLANWAIAVQACASQNENSRLPNIDELSSMLINKKLINLTTPGHFWSGTKYDSNTAWFVTTYYGERRAVSINTHNGNFYARCIKR